MSTVTIDQFNAYFMDKSIKSTSSLNRDPENNMWPMTLGQ